MLKGLNYDRNIVQFYGACIRQGCDPLLITEYMEGGPRPLMLEHAALQTITLLWLCLWMGIC
jgi:hypothetical protein